MAREKTKAEIERGQRAKSAAYERKLKNKNNKFIIISVALILLGYLFFFFSPKIFHEKPERFYTDLGTSVNFSGGSIIPNSWVYAENKKMMQVEFIFKSNKTVPPEIEVNAATSYDDRTKPSSRINADIIYHDSDFYIANIYNIPDNYYCVSLRVKTVEDASETTTGISGDGLGNEVVRELTGTEGASEAEREKEVTSTAVIYTCRDAIEIVHSLYPLDDYIYRIKRIQSNINIDYADIGENNASIETLRSENAALEIRNDELTNEMLYMTSSEKQVNQREIDSNNNSISDNIVKINGLGDTNKDLQAEIQEYEEIIRRIAAESEGREYVVPTEVEQATERGARGVGYDYYATEKPSERPTEAPTQPSTQKPTQKQQNTN